MSFFVYGSLPVIQDLLPEIQSMSGLIFDAVPVSHGPPSGTDWPLLCDGHATFLSS
jgi:hypothetical protein